MKNSCSKDEAFMMDADYVQQELLSYTEEVEYGNRRDAIYKDMKKQEAESNKLT